MRLLLSGGKATLSAGDSSSEGRRAAMRMFARLDVGFKRTAVCPVDEAGRIVWRGVVDTDPEALSRALQHWGGKLAKIGLESGSMPGAVAHSGRSEPCIRRHRRPFTPLHRPRQRRALGRINSA